MITNYWKRTICQVLAEVPLVDLWNISLSMTCASRNMLANNWSVFERSCAASDVCFCMWVLQSWCYLEVKGNRMYLYLEILRYVQIGRLGIVRVIRSKMRWPELVARITAMLHNVLAGKPERNWPHWGSRRRWRDNIKTDDKCSGLDGYDVEYGPPVGACESDNELLVTITGREIWSVWLTVSFLRSTPLRRIGHS